MARSERIQREFAFPVTIAPPLITRYKPGMKYGAHADAAFIALPGTTLRSDLSATIFLTDPKDYDGGELHIRLGDGDRISSSSPATRSSIRRTPCTRSCR